MGGGNLFYFLFFCLKASWRRCYYPHRSRDSVSSRMRNFFSISASIATKEILTSKKIWELEKLPQCKPMFTTRCKLKRHRKKVLYQTVILLWGIQRSSQLQFMTEWWGSWIGNKLRQTHDNWWFQVVKLTHKRTKDNVVTSRELLVSR